MEQNTRNTIPSHSAQLVLTKHLIKTTKAEQKPLWFIF